MAEGQFGLVFSTKAAISGLRVTDRGSKIRKRAGRQVCVDNLDGIKLESHFAVRSGRLAGHVPSVAGDCLRIKGFEL
jgi:hypothetical protein